MAIYCFDLDDTLCQTDGRNYEAARPLWPRIRVVNDLFDQGHTIIVDSARGTLSGEDWHDRTVRQLEAWGVKCHEVRTGRKVYADFYIDDKALSAWEFFVAINRKL